MRGPTGETISGYRLVNIPKTKPVLFLAFLTATACSIHIFENLVMRMLPIPFIRIGLSNIIVLYLILEGRSGSALVVNIVKSVVGGIATLTLLTPGTMLSMAGGFSATIAMLAAKYAHAGFTVYGISVCGAIAHNMAQLVIVRYVVMMRDQVFMLTPILILLGMFSGILTAYLLELVMDKMKETRFEDNEKC